MGLKMSLNQAVLSRNTLLDADPDNGLMAVGSSLAMESVCDALVLSVLEIKGASQERFVNGHPGGIINALSKNESG